MLLCIGNASVSIFASSNKSSALFPRTHVWSVYLYGPWVLDIYGKQWGRGCLRGPKRDRSPLIQSQASTCVIMHVWKLDGGVCAKSMLMFLALSFWTIELFLKALSPWYTTKWQSRQNNVFPENVVTDVQRVFHVEACISSKSYNNILRILLINLDFDHRRLDLRDSLKLASTQTSPRLLTELKHIPFLQKSAVFLFEWLTGPCQPWRQSLFPQSSSDTVETICSICFSCSTKRRVTVIMLLLAIIWLAAPFTMQFYFSHVSAIAHFGYFAGSLCRLLSGRAVQSGDCTI